MGEEKMLVKEDMGEEKKEGKAKERSKNGGEKIEKRKRREEK